MEIDAALETMSVALLGGPNIGPQIQPNVLACVMIVAMDVDHENDGINTDTITVVSPSVADKDFVYLLRYLADTYENRHKEEIASES